MMAVFQKRVNCSKCGQLVPKTATRLIDPLAKVKEFECYACFKNDRTSPLAKQNWKPIKVEYFCGYCNYTFSSRRRVFPYCGKADKLAERNIRVVDLL